jgi:hypothetical protein
MTASGNAMIGNEQALIEDSALSRVGRAPMGSAKGSGALNRSFEVTTSRAVCP